MNNVFPQPTSSKKTPLPCYRTTANREPLSPLFTLWQHAVTKLIGSWIVAQRRRKGWLAQVWGAH